MWLTLLSLSARLYLKGMDRFRTLRNGTLIPSIGFGTFPMRGDEAREATKQALQTGYRMLDTAFNYDNEAAVGKGVMESGVPREDIFVVSKLPGRYHERPLADHAIKESLWRMGLDYMDMYLIHWPNPRLGKFVEAWQALLAARDEGLVREVGVSNFSVTQLALLAEETDELPMANQIECHPYYPQVDMLTSNKDLGIQTISWSPLGKRAKPIDEGVVRKIAKHKGVTPAQVIIRWHMERGAIPIPKSANPDRMETNLDVFNFRLTPTEVEQITALGKPDGRLFNGDPDTHEEL